MSLRADVAASSLRTRFNRYKSPINGPEARSTRPYSSLQSGWSSAANAYHHQFKLTIHSSPSQ